LAKEEYMSNISIKLNPAKIFMISRENYAAFQSFKTKSGRIDIFLPLLPIFIALLFASSSIKPIKAITMDVQFSIKTYLPEIK